MRELSVYNATLFPIKPNTELEFSHTKTDKKSVLEVVVVLRNEWLLVKRNLKRHSTYQRYPGW